MADYIEREAFLKDIEERYCLPCKGAWQGRNGFWCEICWVDDMCGEVIGAPAADVAPVVRCRDCKYFRVYIGHDMCAKNAKLLGEREVGLCATGKDDFCNYGERKKR